MVKIEKHWEKAIDILINLPATQSSIAGVTTIMFNLFRKEPALIKHRYKNLSIDLPSNWVYEPEEGDIEACFDPKSQSTLRFHIIKAIPPHGINAEKDMSSLTGGQSYIKTSKGYILTNPVYKETSQSGFEITLVTWRLINPADKVSLIAVITYTVLSAERESEHEENALKLIINALDKAELTNG